MALFLNSQDFGGGFQDHAVDALLRHRDFKEADILVEGFALLGLLLIDHYPILLRHGVAPAFVEALSVGFLPVAVVCVVERFTEKNAGSRACYGDEWATFSQLIAGKCSHARGYRVGDDAGGSRAPSEQHWEDDEK